MQIVCAECAEPFGCNYSKMGQLSPPMDPITITAAVASGQHAISLLRGIGDGVKSLGKVEIVNQLIEAQLAMMDVLQKHQELQSENHELHKKLREAQELLRVSAKVTYHYEAYWLPRENGSLDGPFSTQVWDTDRKLMRMHFKERITNGGAEPTHLRFICLKFEKYSTIPFEFFRRHRVWSEEQLTAPQPERGLSIAKAPRKAWVVSG
jgi:hypothetical protein